MFFKKKTYFKILAVLTLLLVISFYKLDLVGKILYPYLYQETVEKYASAYEVDPLLVMAVIREESHFFTKSNSHKGALGLMQLMPNTAKEIAVWLHEDYENIDLLKPEDNIRYGTWYLSSLNKQFKGNTMMVLAAYNAGSGRVNSWVKLSPRDLTTYRMEDIPFKETREYVEKVLNSYTHYKKYYGKGSTTQTIIIK